MRFFPIFFALILGGTAGADWTDSARRLTGESESVRLRSIRELSGMKDLDLRLESAFGTPNQFLAYDVLVALDRKSFIPRLIEESKRDPTGYAYHALNALSTGESSRSVLAEYRDRIRDPSLGTIEKVVLLDSLARTSIRIGDRDLDRLSEDECPEVRDSVLTYLRHSGLSLGRSEDLARVARSAERERDPMMKLRAFSILGEVPADRRGPIAPSVREALSVACETIPLPEREGLCERLREEYLR